MKPLPLLSLAFILIVVLGIMLGCGSQESTIDIKADITAINQLLSQYESSVSEENLDLWISLWVVDGIQMPPNSPAVIGRKNIQVKMQSLFDLFDWNMTISGEEVEVAGDWAFARGNYTYVLTPKEEGTVIRGEGKYLTILTRQADGSWKLLRDCFNDNRPPIQEQSTA